MVAVGEAAGDDHRVEIGGGYLTGLDIAWARRKRLAPTRDPEERYVAIADILCERGFFGQKSGRGYYRYERGQPIGRPDPEVAAIVRDARARKGIVRRDFTPEDIVRRCILAMANAPSFNPNTYWDYPQARYRNRAVTDCFEPGSTMKPITLVAALESGRLSGYAADTFEMEDWARPDRPGVVPEALLASEKTVLTPHIGSAVRRVREEIEMAAARSIIDVAEGRIPQHAVNHDAVAEL